ncbi:MAG: hypothetical protein H7263_09305 [Candidatus Sericytochromatia bacterium]|nr:hypothetical protein [Candidatus Sericytochromatia bacterium]
MQKKHLQKRYLQRRNLFILATTLLITTASCDSNIAFNTTRADYSTANTISANLTQLQTGGSIVRVPNISLVPQVLKDAKDIRVALDNSKSTVPVAKNSDGSLTFSVGSGLKIDSDGNFNAIFIVDDQKSYFITVKTGSLLKLGNPAIIVTPSTGTVIKGGKVKLSANIANDAKSKYIFNWFYNGSTGQVPISGTSDNIDWTPPNIGNYTISFNIIDRATGATSSYTSPTALIFVTDSNNIISVSESTILRGKQTTLTANIPNVDQTKYQYTWSVGTSTQAPFSTISGNSQSVDWTPNNSGSYYIKIDALNKNTNQISTYTSTDPIVFVTENENIITTDPSLGNIVRGNSIKLTANTPIDAPDGSYSWSYAASLQAPFLPIPGSGKTIEWTPSQAGSYFIKTDIVDKASNKVSTFISPKAIVFINESDNIFKTDPLVANIKRGKYVDITANIPGAVGKDFQYNWTYSTTGQPNTFQPLKNIIYDVKSSTIKWRPDVEGSFYIKVDAVNVTDQSVLSFSSTTPIVFVNESTPLFKTDPPSGKILQDSNIDLTIDLDYAQGSTFAWSYGSSQSGPWTSIGGSDINMITWDKKNVKGGYTPTGIFIPGHEGKAAGTFFVKVDVTDKSLKDSSYISTFISKSPILFVERQDSTNSSTSFGQPSTTNLSPYPSLTQ